MIKAVLDTNVLVSGLFWTGTSNKILVALTKGKIKCFSSETLLEELEKVLKRDFEYPEAEAKKFVQALEMTVEIISIKSSVEIIKTDSTDNRVLECALDAGAEFIVTQDKRHLLVLKEFNGIKIISPEEFLKTINTATNHTE